MDTNLAHIEIEPTMAIAGVDFDHSPRWPEGITLWQAICDYGREHLHANGASKKKMRRFGYTVWALIEVFDPQKPIESFERNDGRIYTEARAKDGVSGASCRREITFLIAILNHEKREGRTKCEFKLWKPEGSPPRLRFLTREEYARLMRQPMPPRIKRFYLLAFGTGARSEAIEQLTWDRVNLERRTIDYRVPGVRYKNKRRIVAPISDALLPRLEAMYATRKDDYVIGLGPRGRPSTTYHAAKDVLRSIGIDEEGVARHVARHSFASWLLQAEPPVSVYEVAKLLGDDVKMIEAVYGHMTNEVLLRAVNRLN